MKTPNWSSWRGAPALVAEEFVPTSWTCPLCDSKDHQRCRFQAGSLYCVTHDCANPHHRSRA